MSISATSRYDQLADKAHRLNVDIQKALLFFEKYPEQDKISRKYPLPLDQNDDTFKDWQPLHSFRSFNGEVYILAQGILGKGASGIVKLMQGVSPGIKGQWFALKTEWENKNPEEANIAQEVGLAISGKIPVKTQSKKAVYASGVKFIIFQKYGGESLTHYLRTRSLTHQQRLHIAIQLGVAVSKLHRGRHHRKLFHGDIKPDNVLINPETGIITLTDFDLAEPLEADDWIFKYGTKGYNVPKEHAYEMGKEFFDVYSLKKTIYNNDIITPDIDPDFNEEEDSTCFQFMAGPWKVECILNDSCQKLPEIDTSHFQTAIRRRDTALDTTVALILYFYQVKISIEKPLNAQAYESYQNAVIALYETFYATTEPRVTHQEPYLDQLEKSRAQFLLAQICQQHGYTVREDKPEKATHPYVKQAHKHLQIIYYATPEDRLLNNPQIQEALQYLKNAEKLVHLHTQYLNELTLLQNEVTKSDQILHAHIQQMTLTKWRYEHLDQKGQEECIQQLEQNISHIKTLISSHRSFKQDIEACQSVATHPPLQSLVTEIISALYQLPLEARPNALESEQLKVKILSIIQYLQSQLEPLEKKFLQCVNPHDNNLRLSLPIRFFEKPRESLREKVQDLQMRLTELLKVNPTLECSRTCFETIFTAINWRSEFALEARGRLMFAFFKIPFSQRTQSLLENNNFKKVYDALILENTQASSQNRPTGP